MAKMSLAKRSDRAVYIICTDTKRPKVSRTQTVYRDSKGVYVLVDYDARDDVMGVEILGAVQIRRNGKML